MIRLAAPAKLTWFLEVVGRREDGYHLLRSEMTSVGLADDLVLEENEDYLRVTGSHVAPLDDSNLVRRALALVGRRAGVILDKRIPGGGGLGGGSSDAAAILRWAGGVSADEALRLGGDVPFCQVGGRALVSGVGEVVEPLAFEERHLTLLLPDFGVPTGPVYAAFDEMVSSGWRAHGVNHLEEPAGRVEPRLATTLAWARAEFGDVQVAGSGSTLFAPAWLFDTATGDVKGPDGLVRWCQTVTTPEASK